MSSMAGAQAATTVVGKIKEWAVGMLALVAVLAFAGFVTIGAPISYVSLQYNGETVSAKVTHLIYLFVPYKTEHLNNVTAVEVDTIRGEIDYDSHQNRRDRVRSEDQAHLIFVGDGGVVSAMVSPVNMPDVSAKAKAFVANPSSEPLNFVAVANWKFSVLFGGLVSSIVWLLAGCFIYEVIRRSWLAVRGVMAAGQA